MAEPYANALCQSLVLRLCLKAVTKTYAKALFVLEGRGTYAESCEGVAELLHAAAAKRDGERVVRLSAVFLYLGTCRRRTPRIRADLKAPKKRVSPRPFRRYPPI